MNFTRTILNHRHTVWALSIAILIFGLIAYTRLPMQLFPDTAPPLVNIITPYPGSSAEDVAKNLSRPLEEEFASLEGIHKVKSTSQDNLSLISLEFQYNRNVDEAAIDVQNALAKTRSSLPPSIGEPQILKFSTSDRPIITLGITAPDLAHARTQAENIFSPILLRIPGVAAIDIFGGQRQAVIIELDRTKLETFRIPLPRVVETLRAHNIEQPAGRIRTESSEMTFRLTARAKSIDELSQIPITLPSSNNPDGAHIRLHQIATIHKGTLEDDARFAIDGQRTIALQIFKTTEANTVDVVRSVEKAVLNFQDIDKNLTWKIGEESATFTEISVSNLLSNVWQAILLAALIIFFFLARVRASIVAIISMPMSYGITFALMDLANVELNMVTLSAIILSVGMVVDASVVILENIVRHRDELHLTPIQAAIQGTNQISLAVIAGAATTIIVLIPLIFLPGFIGKTFGPLALTLLFAFSSSLIVALVLVPILSLFLRDNDPLDRVASLIAKPFGMLMDATRTLYSHALKLALRARILTLLIALAMLALGILGIKNRGMEVLPKMDSGSFFIAYETPSGSSLNLTEQVAQNIENFLIQQPEIIKTQRQIGFEPGMRSFGATGAQGPTQGFITVTLTPRTERTNSVWDIQTRARDHIATIPDIRTFTVRELGNTAKSTTSAPIIIKLSGDDPLVLDQLAKDTIELIKDSPNLVDISRNWRLDRRRTNVIVDPVAAGRVGLTPAAVAMHMQTGSTGLIAGDFDADPDNPRARPIPILVQQKQRNSPQDLLSFPAFIAESGQTIPLKAVTTLREITGQALVTRENMTPTLEISAFTQGKPLNFIAADVDKTLAQLIRPQGYTVELSGEKDDLAEARGALFAALGISIIAVYLLLVAQLRSFIHPFTIMLSVPLSIAGVSAALGITNKPVSMPVMIGLILLVGIVVNNAIVLIDFIEESRSNGMARREALLESVHVRFRPIMMTSVSTIVGMIPLASGWALGSERFAPLAIAVIGGMIASTILTLIVIPTFYDLLDSSADRIRSLRNRQPQQ